MLHALVGSDLFVSAEASRCDLEEGFSNLLRMNWARARDHVSHWLEAHLIIDAMAGAAFERTQQHAGIRCANDATGSEPVVSS